MFDEMKERIKRNREVKANIKRINPDIDTFTNYEIWKTFKSEGFQKVRVFKIFLIIIEISFIIC